MELEELRLKYNELKYTLEHPRVCLATFFSDLLHEVDLECVKYFQKNDSCQTIEAQDSIAIKINELQHECLQNLPTNQFKEKFAMQVAEILLEIDAKFKESSNDNFELLDDMIYEGLIKVEKEIFLNKGVVFLPAESFLVKGEHFGLLVFVKDEFIGKRERNVLRFQFFLS